MATINNQVWSPPRGRDTELHPAGRWWDAVRVPVRVGNPALERLGERTGAVIEDRYGALLYWFVPIGAANSWELQRVEVRGPACYVGVPPADRTEGPGVRWRVPLSAERYLTDPVLLYDALREAVHVVLGPRG